MASLAFGAIGEVFFKKPPTAIWIQGGHSPLQLFKFSLFISHSVLSLARCCKFLSTIQSQDLHDTWLFPMLLLWIWRRVSHPWGKSVSQPQPQWQPSYPSQCLQQRPRLSQWWHLFSTALHCQHLSLNTKGKPRRG